MKVVLDTNIYIAAFAARGLCTSLFELCLDRIAVIISEHIISEVSKNLSKKIKLPSDKIDEIIEILREKCEVTDYKKLESKICRDADDDNILALAEYNKAEYIITGDEDLLVLEKFRSVPIMGPRGFWEILRKQKDIDKYI